jgi:formamidopyrimidine-DNA glycosylase
VFDLDSDPDFDVVEEAREVARSSVQQRGSSAKNNTSGKLLAGMSGGPVIHQRQGGKCPVCEISFKLGTLNQEINAHVDACLLAACAA